MILFLFHYHRVSDTALGGTPAAAAAAPTGLTLFSSSLHLQPATCPPSTHDQLREKGARGRTTCRSLTIHLLLLLLHSLSLPSFLSQNLLHSVKSELNLAEEHRWSDHCKKIFDLLLFLILRMPLISTTSHNSLISCSCCLLLHSPILPMSSHFLASNQRWKNVQILQIYLYYFFGLCYFFGCIRANKLKHCAITTVLKAIC